MSQATRSARASEIASLQSGVGQYVLRNITMSDLILPKMSLDSTPKKMIGPGQLFIGDSYHLENLREYVRVEQVIDSGDAEPAPAPAPAAVPQAPTQQMQGQTSPAKENRPYIGNLDAAD